MVIYFSGTGNSRYAAIKIANEMDDELVSMNELIKAGGKHTLKSEKPLVFVSPIYGWRLPHVVTDFIVQTDFIGSRDAYFVVTCGADSGNAVQYATRLCAQKQLNYKGFVTLVMPENYVALFAVPDEAESDAIIKKVMPQVIAVARQIQCGETLSTEKIPVSGYLKSSVINPLFYSCIVSDKGFRTTEACTGCGKCTELCPLNNVELSDQKPQWGGNCTHCMACICGCPSEAIEYKKNTIGKRRYYLER